MSIWRDVENGLDLSCNYNSEFMSLFRLVRSFRLAQNLATLDFAEESVINFPSRRVCSLSTLTKALHPALTSPGAI